MNKVIDYYLRENHLSTSDENRYMANVVKKKTVKQKELAFRAAVAQILPPATVPISRRIFSGEKDDFNTDLAAGRYWIRVALGEGRDCRQGSFNHLISIT